MSYEEDGLLRVTAEKGDYCEFQYSEAKQSERGDSNLIIANTAFENRFRMEELLSGYDEEGDVGPYIFIDGDSDIMEEFYAAFKSSAPTSIELVKGTYYLRDSLLTTDEGDPEAKIDVNGYEVSISHGSMNVVCENKEKAGVIFEETLRRLQEDEDWPPELKWYRRVARGSITVSDDVELEEREEKIRRNHTFYDIPLDDGRSVSFTKKDFDDEEAIVILGQSEKSYEDAKKALEDVKEVEGVEVELEDEGGLRDTLKFHSYK